MLPSPQHGKCIHPRYSKNFHSAGLLSTCLMHSHRSVSRMARRWLPQPCPADSSQNKFDMYLPGSLRAISVAGLGPTAVNTTDFHFCSHGDASSGKIHSQTHFSIHIKFLRTPCLLSFLEWPIDLCSGPKPLCIANELTSSKWQMEIEMSNHGNAG